MLKLQWVLLLVMMVLLLMLLLVLLVVLVLWLRLLKLVLWPRDLRGVWQERVKLGVGCRGGKVVRIRLTLAGLGARVDDDDVALFKVVYESMQVLEVETAAGVIAAELVFAFHGGKRVHDGTSV